MNIKGKTVDEETRCVHYHGKEDIIAIKFKCCNEFYACYYCHEETAGHAAAVWNKNAFSTKAIVCGKCKTVMSIHEYKSCDYTCPHCQAGFNRKCSNHDHFYFEV